MTRDAHGFCREHSFLAITVASKQAADLGMAILYEDLVRHTEGEIADARSRKKRASSGLKAHAPCRVCVSAASTEDGYLQILASSVPDSQIGRLARQGGPKLCFPHARRAMALAKSPSERDAIAEIFIGGAEALRRDLLEAIRKRDYRAAHEHITADEANAWARAVYTMVGWPAKGRAGDSR
jgi:hypothetical protein